MVAPSGVLTWSWPFRQRVPIRFRFRFRFRFDSDSNNIGFSGFFGAKGGGVKACVDTTAGAKVWTATVALAQQRHVMYVHYSL